MDGNATAEAFITRQWLPDFPKTPAHNAAGGDRQVNRSSNKNSLFGACKHGAAGCSWSNQMHSATVARLNWPARLPAKSLKTSIREGQAGRRPFCGRLEEIK